MKYIDADKLIAEIERREKMIKGVNTGVKGGDQFIYGQLSALKGLRSFLDTLEAEATPEKLVLKNELTGEVVVDKTIPEHMRGADPEIAYACATLLSAGWTLIAPGFEGVDLEKEIYEAEKKYGDIDEMGGHRILLFDDEFRDILRHFAEWGAKHLKK